MRRVLVLLVVAACGGATATVSGKDAGGADDGGSSSGDATTRPKLDALEACTAPGQCVLDVPGCCGLGCAPLDNLIAVKRGTEQDVIAATCDQPKPAPCPSCDARVDSSIQAFCRDGTCAVVDVRKDTIASCTTDDDCELRYATCCQPCNGGLVDQIVAIARAGEGELTLQLCTGSETCDKCLPSFPGTMYAHCNTSNRHCEVDTK